MRSEFSTMKEHGMSASQNASANQNNRLVNQLKSLLLPNLDAEVQKVIDDESLNNIYRLSFAGMFFMVVALAFFVLALGQFDSTSWVRIGKFVAGFFICLTGFLVARRMRKHGYSHSAAWAFSIAYFIVLSAWVIFVSQRQYSSGEQLFTFYSVMILLVCFIPLKPVTSIVLLIGVFACLYAVLYGIDGAQEINLRNYIILEVVAITGMIANFHSHVRVSEKTVSLKMANEQLEYANHHDALTGLRSRRAMQEDLPGIIGNVIVVRMVDVNSFKQINDAHGHMVGDAVLAETGRKLQELYPGCYCYRYGGDEFLVVDVRRGPHDQEGRANGASEAAVRDVAAHEAMVYDTEVHEAVTHDTGDRDTVACGTGAPDAEIHRFESAALSGGEIQLSVGRSSGCPKDSGQLFDLIRQADDELYEVKRRVHSPRRGGGADVPRSNAHVG